MRLAAQVRGGPTEGENRPAPRTPGNPARCPERRARASEREATALEEEDGGAPAAHSPGLGPPAAGAGFLPEPRSFFLPFPLPLPSLRSDISPKKCTLCADGSGRKRRATSLVRGFRKSLSLEGERNWAAALARRGGVSSRLRGAARTRCAVQATWD